MTYGNGMIWPLASEYAKRGWAVRRIGWDDSTTLGSSGRALRWIIYQNSLFWLLYREVSSGNKVSRVVRNTDFGVDDFFAEDWTVYSPSCSESAQQSDPTQQGKKKYPRPVDSLPVVDPLNPNSKFGACPIVPLYPSIKKS
jgi:hypothetical protein